MRKALTLVVLTVVLIGNLAGRARADGGTVRIHERAGPFIVTVFTAPTPLRAGPVDVSVMVQDGDSNPLLDAEVTVRLVPPEAEGPQAELHLVATRAGGPNRLLYEALATLPGAGAWELSVGVLAGGLGATVATEIQVQPAPPDWIRFWPYLLFPPLAVALFLVHQWRRRKLRLLVAESK